MYSPNNDLYVTYHDKKEVDKLDQNTVLVDLCNYNSRHPYSKNETFFIKSYFMCCPRDKNVNYIYDTERTYHPDWPSRFSYNNNCMYGYCTGMRPGRYDVNGWCCEVIQPKDMAPARFYEPEQTSQCSAWSQARVDYTLTKDG